ncbi:hypothetical protein CAG99_14915 [Streptomyces marincola]|uniref:Uncharacterized protein n=1 Tax=Streptomyces marincola TaxID=2878388 RepID=A0A1W7CZ43_9ACTN|nr:hypothetical protein CAG99_14915 [Streptomyces marincola]
MFVRATTYRAVLAQLAEARAQAGDLAGEMARARDEGAGAEERAVAVAAELAQVREELAQARAEADRVEGALLLEAEDRVALRMLLRTARRQARADRVHVLFHRGEVHSLHATVEAAEAAAEAEGAPRSGWTSHRPGAAPPPADQVAWRIQPMTVGGVQ